MISKGDGITPTKLAKHLRNLEPPSLTGIITEIVKGEDEDRV
jgi:hypothetical protein